MAKEAAQGRTGSIGLYLMLFAAHKATRREAVFSHLEIGAESRKLKQLDLKDR